MMTPSKYKRQYYMPPVKCMKWAEKEYVDRCTEIFARCIAKISLTNLP